MRVVIVEDEKNAQEVLANMLKLVDKSIVLTGFAENVPEAIELINSQKPDVIFLDIHLKNGTGFDVLEKLENFQGKVIFTTAYENYAIKAFKFSAFDYILKPINPQELKTTMKELIKEVHKNQKYNEMLHVFKEHQKNKEKSKNPKIVLKSLNNQYIVHIQDLVRCKSEGAYTKFYLKDKSFLISKNLKHFTEILSEYQFIRTHQSHLVNAEYVLRVNSNNFLELIDGSEIPISSRKKTEVNRLIKKLNL